MGEARRSTPGRVSIHRLSQQFQTYLWHKSMFVSRLNYRHRSTFRSEVPISGQLLIITEDLANLGECLKTRFLKKNEIKEK